MASADPRDEGGWLHVASPLKRREKGSANDRSSDVGISSASRVSLPKLCWGVDYGVGT